MINCQMVRTYVPVVFVAFLSAFCVTGVFGQTGTLRGHIYNESTGEAVSFSNVFLLGTDLRVVTDLDGFFVFAEVPVGTYDLQASFIGYDTLRTSVTLQADQVKYLKLFMAENAIQLQTINVSASLEQRRNEVNVSRITVTPKQIKALPSTGGEADIAQYLMILPGVISTGDQGGRFISGADLLSRTKYCLTG